MMSNFNFHQPVMLKEVIELANLRANSIVVDMTLGRAGHSSSFLKLIGEGRLIGVDQDQSALVYSREHLQTIASNFTTINTRFKGAPLIIKEELGIESVDFIFYDLGVSSPQFDDPLRGFSYRFDARLDMRMDQLNPNIKTAEELINTAAPRDLIHALYEFADEKYAKQIVHNIIKRREKKRITTTFELVDIVKNSLPNAELKKAGHPAKKTFLGIRYLVNSEMEEIVNGIPLGLKLLKVGGRLGVLTFNSYEDGLVKMIFKSATTTIFSSKYLPPDVKETDFKVVTKRPLAPSAEEIEVNNRAKPAKLRVIERIR